MFASSVHHFAIAPGHVARDWWGIKGRRERQKVIVYFAVIECGCVSSLHSVFGKMFSATAVANMLENVGKENSSKPAPTLKPVNMGPASSATEAWSTLYGNNEAQEPKKKVHATKKSYNCQYCSYQSEYQHNRNRHETLVHGIARPPTAANKVARTMPTSPQEESVVEKPKEEPGVGEQEMVGSKKRKSPAASYTGLGTPPKKNIKKAGGTDARVHLPTVEVKEEEPHQEEEGGTKEKETMTEEDAAKQETVGGDGGKWVKIDTDKTVVYARYAVLHICA